MQIDPHIQFVKNLENDKSFEQKLFEPLRMSGIYWGITALDLMNSNCLNEPHILDIIHKCGNADGGYGASPGHDSHLLYTLSAIQVLVFYDKLDVLDIDLTCDYIKKLQNSDGSFCGDKWGEVDTRFSYCAVASLSLIGRLHLIDKEKAISFINQCQNFDSAYGAIPGAESHAGQDYVNHKKLSRWLMKRQLPNGGLNGRPEKLADVCYCWWVLSALSILGTVEWLSKPKLIDFILSCQDSEGGFSDRPGDYPDVFHTLFAICGLSMLGFDQVSLGQVDPVYCLPTTVIDRHFKRVSEQKAQKDQ